MKKSKKQVKLKYIFVILLIVACIILIILSRPYYQTKDRVNDISTYKSDNVSNKPLGWLRVQGTNIDFPIFYYDDVEDISNPDKDLGWSYENNKKLTDRTVVLSHNMRNISKRPLIANENHARFEQLMSYMYYDFAKENKYIQYTIDGKNNLFKIYAVYLEKEENIELYNIDKKEKKEYIKNAEDNSYFDYKVDVSKDDQLLTLVTCTRFYGDSDYSFVIEARKVRELEIINDYKVTKKSNYNKIENILKGED